MYCTHPFKKLGVKLAVINGNGKVHFAQLRLREPIPSFPKGRWDRRFYLYLQWREGKSVREEYIGKIELKHLPAMKPLPTTKAGRQRRKDE